MRASSGRPVWRASPGSPKPAISSAQLAGSGTLSMLIDTSSSTAPAQTLASVLVKLKPLPRRRGILPAADRRVARQSNGAAW